MIPPRGDRSPLPSATERVLRRLAAAAGTPVTSYLLSDCGQMADVTFRAALCRLRQRGHRIEGVKAPGYQGFRLAEGAR